MVSSLWRAVQPRLSILAAAPSAGRQLTGQKGFRAGPYATALVRVFLHQDHGKIKEI